MVLPGGEWELRVESLSSWGLSPLISLFVSFSFLPHAWFGEEGLDASSAGDIFPTNPVGEPWDKG